MAATITPFPKDAQTGRKRKPKSPDLTVEDVEVRELPLARINVPTDADESVPGFRTDTDIASLSDSIREHGVLQAILVRPGRDGQYDIIAGRRRYKASKKAGLPTIPVIVKMPTDATAAVQSLVENLERRDLSPLDEARAFKTLLESDPTLTQAGLGAQIGRRQAYISNSLRLLNTDPEVQESLGGGKISVAHAKAIASLTPEVQREVAGRIARDKISSRQIEAEIHDAKEREKREAAAAEAARAEADETIAILHTAKVAKNARIFVRLPAVAESLKAEGYKNVEADQFGAIHKYDRTETKGCDCTPFKVEFHARSVVRVCIDEGHVKAFKKERDAGKVAAASANAKRLEKARRAAEKALRSNGSLNIDGQRLALYVLVKQGNGSNAQLAQSLVKRYGGEGSDVSISMRDYKPVWDAIVGMTDADLAEELAKYLVAAVMPNVFGESARWEVDKDLAVRSFLVDQFGIDDGVVRGIHEVRRPLIADPVGEIIEGTADAPEPMGDGSNDTDVIGSEELIAETIEA